MRCGKARDIVSRRGDTAELRTHLSGCAACAQYARDSRLVSEGLRALASEPVPEPGAWFRPALLARLEQTSPARAASFVENIGRRFVYAALAVTAALVLLLLLPSSGPVRSPSTVQGYLPQQEAWASQSYPIFPGQLVDFTSRDQGQK